MRNIMKLRRDSRLFPVSVLETHKKVAQVLCDCVRKSSSLWQKNPIFTFLCDGLWITKSYLQHPIDQMVVKIRMHQDLINDTYVILFIT